MQQYPKNILSIQQQLQSYIDAGMVISSTTEVEEALRTIGFYRLRGYSFQLYDNANKQYFLGTSFDDIMKNYNFDQELSELIFSMISKIEVALRVRLTDALLIHGDALILQDSSIFKDKKKYWSNLSSVSSEIARSNDVFIKHNFNNHDGEIPVWAAVEVMSFGTLSKLIKNLKTGKGSSYSVFAENYKYLTSKGNNVKPSLDMLSSWIHTVSIVRNMCAHNSRLYNRTIHTSPEIIAIDRSGSVPVHCGLYQVLLAMKYIRPTDKTWNEFVDGFKNLLTKYNGWVSLTAMNLPADWESHLRV